MLLMDLDGVFSDFATAACCVHGHPETEVTKWDFFGDWTDHQGDPMNLKAFWKTIHLWGDKFYRDMVQPYPWAIELLHMVESVGDEWAILTAPSNSPYGYSGKKIWVDKYLQPYADERIKLVVTSDKTLLANPKTLLVDDSNQNIVDFTDANGNGLFFPQPWNRAWDFVPGSHSRMTYMDKQLTRWSEFLYDNH